MMEDFNLRAWLYFTVNVGSSFFPFIFSFNKRIGFSVKWKETISAIFPVAVVFVTWDHLATKTGHWGFNPRYITGIYLFNLPIEEVMFFFFIPYSCIFIYHLVRKFTNDKKLKIPNYVSIALIISFICVSFLFRDREYSFLAFMSCAVFLSSGAIFFKRTYYSRSFWISILVIYVPFLIVNGILTYVPVVTYSSDSITNVRIGSIPIEDFFYNLSLVGFNLSLFEWFTRKKQN